MSTPIFHPRKEGSGARPEADAKGPFYEGSDAARFGPFRRPGMKERPRGRRQADVVPRPCGERLVGEPRPSGSES